MANPAVANLALSNVINVTVLAPGAQLGAPNMSALGVITSAAAPGTWAAGQTFGYYTSPNAVATDWGTGSDMANMATAIFSQNANILSGGGYLIIVPRLQSPSLETITACLARIAPAVFFEGFMIDTELGGSPSTFLAIAAYAQANQQLFFYASSNVADLNPGSILDQARTSGDTYTRCMYYGGTLPNAQTQVFAAAYAGRGMSVNFAGANTMLAMQLQTLATINPDQTVGQAQLALAQTAGVDVYVSISGIPCVFTSGANLFYDQVYARSWLQFGLQVAGFNYLKNAAQVPGKIPQTESGMAGLRDAYTQVFLQGIRNGYMAPGSWTLPFSFGNPAAFAANILAQGYYIVSQPVAQQAQAARSLRQAPVVQAAIKEAGALQSSSVIVYCNP
jgi:hypothetical protein